jgi:hypothetical protein
MAGRQTVIGRVSAYRDNQNWHIQMTKLGTEKRPIIVRIHTDEKARHVAETARSMGAITSSDLNLTNKKIFLTWKKC